MYAMNNGYHNNNTQPSFSLKMKITTIKKNCIINNIKGDEAAVCALN